MTDDSINTIVMDYVQGSDHPDLAIYRRNIRQENMHLWNWKVGHACQLGHFYDKRILEAGSGFGWDAVGISLKGRNHVVAMDILAPMVDGMTQCLESAKAKGRPLNVEPLQGDICNVDLPEGSFDGIFSSEAVEHVHSLEQMFHRCYQLLKPGARLVIFNDSNQFNTKFRESTFEMWKERDESWEHAKWLKRDVRPIEHKDAKPYFAMRESIIQEFAPELSADRRKVLTEATAGMIRPEILEATRTFVLNGSVPIRPRFSWCRNPETGEYAERLLDPFAMRDMLRERGFKTQLRHIFRKTPHRFLNGISFRPLNKMLFDLRAQFALVAEKPA